LADLIFTPWMGGRTEPLQLYGPPGTKKMVDNILAAYSEDIGSKESEEEGETYTARERRGQNNRNPGAPANFDRGRGGHKVEVEEIKPGRVYKDANVLVTAFLVKHDRWKEPLGYRFDAVGKSIVISGDTNPVESVVDACSGCDVLIHEAFTGNGTVQDPGNPFKKSG